MSPRAELLRVVRFAVVGLSNTAVTVASYAVLVAIGLFAPVASAAAFGLGAANGYRWNRRWTFASAAGGGAVAARYVAVQALGAALSAGGVALLTSAEDVRRLAAEVVILPLVTLTTYLLVRTAVFA